MSSGSGTRTKVTSKTRIYHLAAKYKVANERVLEVANELGLELPHHLALVDEEWIEPLSKALEPERGTGKPVTVSDELPDMSRFGVVQPARPPAPAEVEAEEAPVELEPAERVGEEVAPEEPARPAAPAAAEARPVEGVPRFTVAPPPPPMAPPVPAKGVPRRGKERPVKPERYGRVRERRVERGAKLQPPPPTAPAPVIPAGPRVIEVEMPVSVKGLSQTLGIKTNILQRKLLELGVVAKLNDSLAEDVIELLAAELDREITIKKAMTAEETLLEEARLEEEQVGEEAMAPRAPVVTFLGHVDHGKTSLLDAIRKTKVVETEAGGITQRVGACRIRTPDGKDVVFLDTPGHQAFTEMRARGAKVTDLVVLVVAADDGVMPQTEEAIDHAKAADVPILVAINKVDKPNAHVERVRQQLAGKELVPEEWGGDTIMVPCSAVTGMGIDDLLEMITLRAEMLELRATPTLTGKGTVLEAGISEGKGIYAHVLVQDGTLRVGEEFLCGMTFGRIRSITDDQGRSVVEAGPSTPVEITGFQDLPHAGDKLRVVRDLKKAMEVAETRQTRQREKELAERSRVTLGNLFEQIEAGKAKELRLVIKADGFGSVEVLKRQMEELSQEKVKVRIIRAAVGGISESDILLAETSDAIVIGFNVVPEAAARNVAEEREVEIRLYQVIYQLLDDIRLAMQGLLEPIQREQIAGHAEIRKTFKASGVGTIGGCFVQDGLVHRNHRIRLIRENVVIYEGRIQTLKRFKDDVREVKSGFECGIKIEGYDDIKEGDVIETFEVVEEKQVLK